MSKKIFLILLIGLVGVLSCKKIGDDVVLSDNQIPWYEDVPTVVIENYITRIYIDLLGRDPLDQELLDDYELLVSNDLDTSARAEIVVRLQTDSTAREEEISYKHQYYQRFYDLNKARFIEGASEAEIQKEINDALANARKDSITGDSTALQVSLSALNKLYAVVNSRDQLRVGSITYEEMAKFMMNNAVYDLINMNTFNFINASFSDMFFRMPTTYEYDNAFDAIENNISVLLFGMPISNKQEYLDKLTLHRTFYEGTVIWVYQSLLARTPRVDEMYNWTVFLSEGGDIKYFQKEILISDEYATFRSLN